MCSLCAFAEVFRFGETSVLVSIRKEVADNLSRVFGRIEGERLVSCIFAMGTRVSG